MKINLKVFGSILAVCISVTACDKSDFTPLSDQKDPIVEHRDNFSAIDDSIVLGDLIVKPLINRNMSGLQDPAIITC
jgi:hypothetical protein